MFTNVILVIVLLLNFVISIFVYKSSKTKIYARYFFYFILFSNIWILSNYLIDQYNDISAIILVTKVTFSSVSMMATALLLFSIYYPSRDEKLRRIFEYSIIAFGFLVSIASFSSLIVKGIKLDPIANEVVFGWMYPFYFTQLIAYLLLSFFFMLSNYFRVQKNLKPQMQYLFLGLFIALVISLFTNALMPIFFNDFSLSILGPFSMVAFIGFTSYAIIKHRLMDIRFIVVRSIVYSSLVLIFSAIYMFSIFILGGLVFGEFTGREAYWASMILAVSVGFTFYPLKNKFTKWTDKVFFKDRYDFEELTNELNETATSTIVLPELLFKFLNLLIDEMRITKGAFVLLEKNKIYEVQTLGFKESFNLSEEEIEHLAKEKKTEVYEEAPEDSKCREIMRNRDSMVIVPLIVEDELIGLLFLGEKKSGDPYSNRDIEVIKIVSKQLSLGIQNAKAYEKTQKFNLILRAEVNRVTRELRLANEKLQELDKAKDEFISLASHEIRTPIATLEGYVSLLNNPKLPNSDRKMIQERAYEGVTRLETLAKDLLDVSRIEQKRLKINKEPERIERLIDRAVEGFELRAKDKKIYVRHKKPDKLVPEIMIDSDRISEVLNNLIGNAIKFTHKGGITVSEELKGKEVLVSVADTGEGIPKDDIKNLFQKFYQAQTASSILGKDKGGTGLGLYITKHIVEAHGGKIWVESKTRKGTTFYFTLPLK